MTKTTLVKFNLTQWFQMRFQNLFLLKYGLVTFSLFQLKVLSIWSIILFKFRVTVAQWNQRTRLPFGKNTSNLHNSQKLHTSDKMLNNLYHLVTVQIVNSLGQNISFGHLKIFIFLVMVNTFEEDAGLRYINLVLMIISVRIGSI